MKKIIFLFFINVFLFANGGDFWGINASNLSLGGSQTSGVNDYSAAYYNPAKLPFIGVNNGVGMQYSMYKLNIDFKDNRDENSKKFFNTDEVKKLPDNYYSYTLGFTVPIFKSENYGMTLGFVNNYIEDDIAKISVYDEKIYQFYRYNSDIKTLLMNLGVGIVFLKKYSFGVGVAQLVSVVGQTDVHFKIGYDDDDDSSNDSFITSKDLYLGVVNERAYNFSFYYEGDFYSVGGIYKQKLSLPYKIPASIVLKDFNGEGEDATISLLIEGIGVWFPDEFDIGVTAEVKKISSIFHLNLSYQYWSKAPVPYSFTVINSDAELLKLEDLKSNEGTIYYKDTLNVNLGYEFYFKNSNVLRMGFSYMPSLIYKHDKYTNFADNDTVSFSFGAMIKLFSFLSENLYFNMAYSLRHAIYREEYNSYYRDKVKYGGDIHLFYFDLLYR